ncbi:hypothetical protein GETHPA_19410 [Geothrix rubra]|uniref:Cation/H+ exchanger transmembrane domain-containing protein n=1 Tax=Geothrix rubra TaxID=2927977 RepID=A0ABQ5Q7G4_9BACT|nr:cation:proton antiporter [Geothrix rubra]GLH70408.1 hypothetical protein GETHPA_19410 [Geothrix rubra]
MVGFAGEMLSPEVPPSSSTLAKPNRLRVLAFYLGMIGIAIGLFLLIDYWGVRAVALHSSGTAAPAHLKAEIPIVLHVLLALAVIILTTRTIGNLFAWFQQPPVVGEVIGGILLGPSLLGRIAPEMFRYLLPHSVAPFLNVIAQLGVILYMFLVGMELDLKVVTRSGHAALAISHASILVPFLLGALVALGIYPIMAEGHVSFTMFALFLGISMSITAFPVLARILTDRGVSKTRMGSIALACAAVDDVTAWCLLALVISLAKANVSSALVTWGLTAGYIAFVFILLGPLVRRGIPWLEKTPELTRTGMAVIFVAMLMSSMATEFIGIHAIFGAFLLGTVIPHDSKVTAGLTHRLHDVISVLFLPAFFAFTGMRTQVALISGAQAWAVCGLIVLCACAGKFGGSAIASKLVGLNWRDASSLGILMNTRGLVELIALNIGLDLGVISPTLFAMLVIMALTTTLMTTPILHLLTRKHPWV